MITNKPHIRRKYLSIFLILIISIVFGFYHSTPLYAATLDQLTKQKTELQKMIEAKNKEAAEKKKQAEAEKQRQADLAKAIQRLSGDISTTENKLSQTQSQITDTQGAITVQQQKIVEKEAEITQKQKDISETAVVYYIELDQGNELYALLASDRISSALDRAVALESLADKLLADKQGLEQNKQDLLAQQAQLQQREADLKTQRNQLTAYQSALDSQKNQKQELVGESKEAQAQYLSQASEAQKVSADLKKQFAAVASEEEAMRRAASKRGAATANRSANPSALGFVWPVDGVISTRFGESTPFQAFHTGLDVAGPAGDPVVATASGVVVTATKMCCSDYSNTVDKSYGYGNWVEIQHDNGYVSRYGHLMRFAVSPGERVERGQVIGYRGGALGMPGAGWSTGAHLHFEIRDSKGPDDPLKYLP